MTLSLVDGPIDAVMSLEDAKAQARIDVDDDDGLLAAYIAAVAERGEIATKRAFLTQTWDLVLDEFPRADYIEMPKPPLQRVASVTYLDTQGVLQTATLGTQYKVQAPGGPRCARGRVYLPFAAVWPVTLTERAAVQIRFVCGYGAADDLPPLLVQAMKLDLGSLYENREGVIMGGLSRWADELPMGVSSIYQSFESFPTQRLAVAS